jgi:hypothetical protein
MISRRGQTLVNNWHEKPAHDRHVSFLCGEYKCWFEI